MSDPNLFAPVQNVNVRKWTDEHIAEELLTIADSLGNFPSNTELLSMSRGDLAGAVNKSGGFLKWSEKLGIPRKHSDSDTGWDGEIEVADKLRTLGFGVVRSENVKSPFDLMVDEVLRVDVKSARFASYKCDSHSSSGWFYRIGKHPQADVILLYQLDTKDFYAIPWWDCPTSNITITPTGETYAKYRNDVELIRAMVKTRCSERRAIAG